MQMAVLINMKKEDTYKSIRLPKNLIAKVDEYIENHPEYRSRLELLAEAIRMHIKEPK